MYSKFTVLIFLFAPLVSACEGECIVSITKAFIGNYSTPIHSVLKELSEEISTKLLPLSQRPADPITFMQPIFTAYTNDSYDALETAIFPSYFHGKCQRFSKDGRDPPGCPDPDCPVVCGTPGSLVHFYPTLRYIAFNNTRTTLEALVTPGNPAYEQVDATVRNALARRRDSVARAADYVHVRAEADADSPIAVSNHPHAHVHARYFGSLSRRHSTVSRGASKAPSTPTPTLASILAQLGAKLEGACGGDATDSKDALPKCSWEAEMKTYILSFP